MSDFQVLFVDDAHQLNPSNSSGGRAVMSKIIDEIENRKRDFVVIFGGYKDKIEQQLIPSDRGLRRRFQFDFKFEDYSDEELTNILHHMLKKEKCEVVDEKYVRIAA